jgi:hypothetical protein
MKNACIENEIISWFCISSPAGQNCLTSSSATFQEKLKNHQGLGNKTEKTDFFLNETERKENGKVMKRNGTKRISCETETKRNEISVKR